LNIKKNGKAAATTTAAEVEVLMKYALGGLPEHISHEFDLLWSFLSQFGPLHALWYRSSKL